MSCHRCHLQWYISHHPPQNKTKYVCWLLMQKPTQFKWNGLHSSFFPQWDSEKLTIITMLLVQTYVHHTSLPRILWSWEYASAFWIFLNFSVFTTNYYLCTLFNIKHNLSIADRHQSVGTVKCNHRKFNGYIRQYLELSLRDWEKLHLSF